MPRIELLPSTTREQLRESHELIASGDGRPVELLLGPNLVPRTPGQFSAWMQLVLTWGQDTDQRVLQLADETRGRLESLQPLSDIEVVAVVLAQEIRVRVEDVTARVQPLARKVLAERRTLVAHEGDGPAVTQSLLLAAHTFTNRTSPDLHALWDGELAVEESARTLYHDVWPLASTPNTLRPPQLEFNEVAVPSQAPTHISRAPIPDGSRVLDHPFISLGARVPQIRGLAMRLATEVRVQPKPLHDEIGEVLFELVQNTEWHAAKWAGGRTGANCRVLTFREYAYSPEELSSAEHFDPNFVAYARAAAQSAQRRSGRRISRMVLGTATIIDSGVGLARSVALSLDEEHLLSPETEISYLIAALSKNIKKSRADLGNVGLARVQQSLTNLSGFMSIRTGTVEILRDFVTRPFEPLQNTPKRALPSLFVEWVPPREEEFIVGPRLGTAVTIAYPVDFEVEP